MAIGVWIVLRAGLGFADIDLADQRGDVLVILVAGLGLRDLAQPRWLDLGHPELRDVAAERLKALVAPGAHQPREAAAENAVFLLDHRPELFGIEQAQRRLEHRAQIRRQPSARRSDGLPSAIRAARPMTTCRRQQVRADRESAFAPQVPERRAGRSQRCARWFLPCRGSQQRPDRCASSGSKRYGQGVGPWPCQSSGARRSRLAIVRRH
jgi:hypothetical protein